MPEGEQEQQSTPAEPAKLREILIETNGATVNVKKNELTPLEVKEICRMLLKQLGG